MYYELYVDILFLVNFMMDYLLLCLLRKMLSCTATQGRILFGAAVGSALTCVVVILPIPYAFVKFILFHTMVNTVMIRAGLKIRDLRTAVKAYILLYIGAFLLGGMLEAFSPYVKYGSLFFAVAVIGYYVTTKFWDFITTMQRINQYQCEVELCLGEKLCRIRGIIDTGNGLTDPITKQPVSVLDRSVAQDFLGGAALSGVHYIPYRSIGKTEGVLTAVKIDKMCIHGERECRILEPLIAVSEECLSDKGEYHMILNPNIF